MFSNFGLIPRNFVLYSGSSVATSGRLDGFGDLRLVEKTPIIELSSIYDLTTLRDAVTVSGTGTVANATGENRLHIAGASSSAQLQSVERCRYMPGYSAEVGVGVRMPALPTGDQIAKWGIFGSTDGFYFGCDSTGVFAAVLRGGSETKTYQTSWNVDKMDGDGTSGRTLDLSRGNIFVITFTWYGYGAINFGVVNTSTSGEQLSVTVHRYAFASTVSIENPNQPITCYIGSTDSTSTFSMYIGGRQCSIVGRYVPSYRINSQYVVGATVDTTKRALISFRRKTGRENVSIRVE
jgi:hypothetical protein